MSDTPTGFTPAASFGSPAELPAEILQEIDKSVEEFRKRWGVMSMVAEANGWVRDYRGELERIARMALKRA